MRKVFTAQGDQSLLLLTRPALDLLLAEVRLIDAIELFCVDEDHRPTLSRVRGSFLVDVVVFPDAGYDVLPV
ncbi:hypothetical protein MZK47_09900 [Microbacterium aerolatum]|nr:hypothetical protein [Microbacterium aerolatum]MCK3769980.1 hypothetical protein [Microbacterium aerolatum]